MSQNRDIRELNNVLVNALSLSPVCAETKRILLTSLAKTYELEANMEIQAELTSEQTVTEEGELNGSKLDEGSRCE